MEESVLKLGCSECHRHLGTAKSKNGNPVEQLFTKDASVKFVCPDCEEK